MLLTRQKGTKMTPNKVIERIDEVKPNPYSEETKLGWMSELDGMVKRLVIQELESDIKPYIYPEDMDSELLIKYPFDSLYMAYVEARIDFYNHEYGNYNNSAMVFENAFTEYKKAYIREHPAKG